MHHTFRRRAIRLSDTNVPIQRLVSYPARSTPRTKLKKMWIRHVLLELGITLIIVLATIADLTWARWIVIAYTGLMVLLKIVAVVGSRTLKSIQPTNRNVPTGFWHVNYAVNIFLLAADAWWLMVSAWALIWILSVVYDRQVGPAKQAR